MSESGGGNVSASLKRVEAALRTLRRTTSFPMCQTANPRSLYAMP